MNDVQLWHLLDPIRTNESPTDELTIKQLLGELSQLGLRNRMPFLSRLCAYRCDHDPVLRCERLKVLSGVSGWRAWQFILDAMDDSDQSVQRTAVLAMLESAQKNPWLLTHLVFHSNPEIRKCTLQHFLSSGQAIPSQLLHLVLDEACKDQVLQAIANNQLADQSSPLLVATLHRSGHLTDAIARRLIGGMNQNEFMVALAELPRFSEGECESIVTQDRSEEDMVTLRPMSADFDGLVWMFGLFWDVDENEIDSMGLEASRFFENVEQWLQSSVKPIDPKHLLASASVAASIAGRWNIRVANLCVLRYPPFLVRTSVPRLIRRSSAVILYRLRNQVQEAEPHVIREILSDPICRRENGHLDLWLLGAIMHFRHEGGLNLVLDSFTETQIVAAFLADPNDSASFFTYSGSIDKRQGLIEAIRSQRGPLSMFLDALLMYVVPADGLQFLDPLTGQQTLSLLSEAIKLNERGDVRLSDRKLTIVAELFVNKLSEDQAIVFLDAWISLDAPLAFPLGREMLGRFVRASISLERFAEFAKDLDAASLRKLLECIQHCSGVPYGFEVRFAIQLVGHSDPIVNEWAIARAPASTQSVKQEAAPKLAEPIAEFDLFEETLFVTISDLLASRIASCSDSELASVVADCLKIPARGLCGALAARSAPTVFNVETAVAILGCADSLESIDEQFCRFAPHQKNFLNQVELMMVSNWQPKRDLPLVATAWLSRWEEHAFHFAKCAMFSTERLSTVLAMASQCRSHVLSRQFWFATHRVLNLWRFRHAKIYVEFFDARLVALLVANLSQRDGDLAAEMLMSAHSSNRLHALLEPYRAIVVDQMPDCLPEIRTILQPWIDTRGYAGQYVVGRKGTGRVDQSIESRILSTTDIDELMELCRHHDAPTVICASMRCAKLGGKWLDSMIDLMLRQPAPVHSVLLANTFPSWSIEQRMRAEQWLSDQSLDSATRFVIGLHALEGDREHLLERICNIICEPASPSWLQRDDLSRLRKRAPSDNWLAQRIAVSPHPHAYRFAISELVCDVAAKSEEQGGIETDDGSIIALRAFLDCGSERSRNIRLEAAIWLMRCGDHYGYPLLLEMAADEYTSNNELKSFERFPVDHVVESMEAGLLAGYQVFSEDRLLDLLQLNRNSPDEFHEAALMLNSSAVSNKLRQTLARFLRNGLTRAAKLRDVAETFAWGIPIARQLTERLFTVEMIGGDDYGYTRLNENKISINPLPILQRKADGRKIVEGLILHELGHHMYHRGEEEEKLWDKARSEGMGGLLNLVADEHLERNLRALDSSYGDRLKKLGAYAFQHSNKEVNSFALLESLGIRAFEVLCRSKLKVARRPYCVGISTRRALHELEHHGMSFSRFFRALRLGLGNRYNDPKVEEALALFGKNFRTCTMADLYDITCKLRSIFGSECKILECLGQDRIMDGEGSQVMIDGEGINNGDLQSEIQRITNPKGIKPSKMGGGRWINVSDENRFNPITMIERVTATAEEHSKYASQILRYANQLRLFLSKLGVVMVPERRRIRGRSLDRSSLQSAILKGDPRILKLRETRFETDLYIAVLVDCSGSMSYDDNIEKAKLFGALMTEAVRGVRGIDLQIFGFTDSVIYDAGSSYRPGLASLVAGGGNNDAAALLHAAQQAQFSRRKAKLLVMISDGLPTECSVDSLKALVGTLTRKWKMCCAQVAVRPLEEICFPDYVLLDTTDPSVAVREFGSTIARLIRKSLSQS